MNEVQNFLTLLEERIKYKKAVPQIRQEFEQHIEELAGDLIEAGMPEEEAYQTAVLRMGDPEQIGKELNKTYRPMYDWTVILLTAVLTLAGYFILQTVNAMGGREFFSDERHLWSTLAGVLVFVIALKGDYQKLYHMSWKGFLGVTVILYLYLKLFGTQWEPGAMRIWTGFGYVSDLPGLVIPLYVVTFAAVMIRFCTGNAKDYLKMLALSAAALIVFLQVNRFSHEVVLAAIFLGMLTYGTARKNFTGNRLGWLAGVYGISGLAVVGLVMRVFSHPYQLHRIQVMLNPSLAPMEGGYQGYVAKKAMASAKWFGQTQVSLDAAQQYHVFEVLPDPHNNFILTSVISIFGWGMAVILLILFALFIWRILRLSKSIKDDFGKILTVGISLYFIVQIVFSVLVNLTVLPPTSLGIPFLSYGGISFIGNMFLVGILLNIYRRKNLLVNQCREQLIG